MLPNLDENVDPRVKRTRKMILDAFLELLDDQNFSAITVKNITDKAEINRATFYAHFQDKFELLDVAMQHLFMQEIERRTLNVCSYSPENLRNLILAVCDFLGKLHSDCGQPHETFESLVEGPIKRQVMDLLAYWLRDSKVPTEIPVTVATWAIYGLASHYAHAQSKLNLEKFVDEALPLVSVNLEQFA